MDNCSAFVFHTFFLRDNESNCVVVTSFLPKLGEMEITKQQESDVIYFESYGDIKIHKLMLNDKPRTETYQKAIDNCAEKLKDKVVLDGKCQQLAQFSVGAGSGILSMFAAKYAKKVYAVEANPSMAQIAKQFISDNKLSSKVQTF